MDRDWKVERVMEHMHEGRAPSEIDRAMMLRRGEAHDIVVDYWHADKLRGKRRLAEGEWGDV